MDDKELSNQARAAMNNRHHNKAIAFLDKMSNRVLAMKMERLVIRHKTVFGSHDDKTK